MMDFNRGNKVFATCSDGECMEAVVVGASDVGRDFALLQHCQDDRRVARQCPKSPIGIPCNEPRVPSRTQSQPGGTPTFFVAMVVSECLTQFLDIVTLGFSFAVSNTTQAQEHNNKSPEGEVARDIQEGVELVSNEVVTLEVAMRYEDLSMLIVLRLCLCTILVGCISFYLQLPCTISTRA